MNNIEYVTVSNENKKLIPFSKKTRFLRQVQKLSNKNNKEDNYRQYIKERLDLQSKDEEDIYDYSDNGSYINDHHRKNANGFVGDRKYSNVDNKFKTRTLGESQEKKLCIMKCIQNLGPEKLQQQLHSDGKDEGKESTLSCNDCKNLKSNINLLKSKNEYNSNSRINSINDDYFINILKQLINKLNMSNGLKSTYIQDVPLERSNGLSPMKNKLIKGEIKNNSSEDEWILRFEKINGDQIIERLNSSPENTYVNGKWVKNKILNKCNDCKSIGNDQRSDFNDTNGAISETDTIVYNLNNPENQVMDTNTDNLKNLINVPLTSILENKEILTSTLPEENEYVLASRQTDKPEYSTSTLTDKLDYTANDNKWKYTTKDFKEKLNDVDIFTNNETSNTNQDKPFKPTINQLHPNEGELNEEIATDLNNTLKINNFEGNIHDNDNQLVTNFLEGVTVVSDPTSNEKDNNINCNRDKKVIKNILNSIMIKNITEIKTDTYIVPNELKVKNHKSSDKLLKKNLNTSKLENTTNDSEIIKINNDRNYKSALLKNQIPYKNQNQNNPNESMMITKLQGSRNNKINRNIKNILKSTDVKIPEFKLKNERKINNKVKINNDDEIEKKRKFLLPIYLRQHNPRQYAVELKEKYPNENNTYIRNNFDEYNNINKITINNDFSKSSSRNIPKLLKEHTKNGDIITKQTQRKVTVELKQATPINLKTYISRNFSNNDNADHITATKQVPFITKKFSQVPKKNMNNTSSKIVLRRLGKFEKYRDDITTEYPNKIDKKLEYNLQLNTSAQTSANTDGMYNENNLPSLKKSKNNIDFNSVKLRKPLSLIKSSNITTNITKIPFISKNNSFEKISNAYAKKISNDAVNSNNRIIKNKISLKPVQAIKTSSMIPSDTITLKNNKMSTTLKSKKSLNDIKKKIDSNGLIKSKLLEVSNEDIIYDYEHAPYKIEDLEPIIFDEPVGKFINPKKNHSNNIIGLKPLQTVPIIRPEYDDYYDNRGNNKDEENIVKQYNSKFNISNYDSINDNIVNLSKYQVENLEGKYENQSRFEIIPGVKVVDAVFKIPLVGHTHFDNNGSKYISDLFIPIEKSDNQHKAISLTELLNGNFHLVNEYDEHSLGMETPSPREIESTFIECVPEDGNSPDITRDKSFDIKTFKILQSSKENEKQTTPIHVIQIINNGLCSDNSAIKTTLKSKHKDEAQFNKFRNADRRLSSIKLKNIPNSKQKNKKFGDAYNHFDSDILDRFLQVYSPVRAV